MDRSGRAPNALGLTGTAGLQLKKPAKKFGLQKPKQAARPTSGSVFGDAAVEDSLDVSEELERMRQSKAAAIRLCLPLREWPVIPTCALLTTQKVK